MRAILNGWYEFEYLRVTSSKSRNGKHAIYTKNELDPYAYSESGKTSPGILVVETRAKTIWVYHFRSFMRGLADHNGIRHAFYLRYGGGNSMYRVKDKRTLEEVAKIESVRMALQ